MRIRYKVRGKFVRKFDPQISKNFNVIRDKLYCRHCGVYEINSEVRLFNKMVQEFREWYNRSMIVSSGERCTKHNRNIGGSKRSKHAKFTAYDIVVPNEFYTWDKARRDEFYNNIKKKWQEICRKYNRGGGVGRYDNPIRLKKHSVIFHIDSRKKHGSWVELRPGKYGGWK